MLDWMLNTRRRFGFERTAQERSCTAANGDWTTRPGSGQVRASSLEEGLHPSTPGAFAGRVEYRVASRLARLRPGPEHAVKRLDGARQIRPHLSRLRCCRSACSGRGQPPVISASGTS